MIRTFSVNDPAMAPVSWWHTVFKDARSFDFGPGINVLWGPNGSGKTTVIRALARLFHCEQSGFPVVTSASLNSLLDRRGSLFRTDKEQLHYHETLRASVTVQHDGQGVCSFDPSVAPGLLGGGAAFDDDFFSEGVVNTMFKGSSGQTTEFRLQKVLATIVNKQTPNVERRMRQEEANGYHGQRIQVADAWLKPSIEQGPPTILFDEPERSFDLQHQIAIWRVMRAYADEVQFIVASHNFFALQLPEAHYIEMTPGYLNLSLGARKLLDVWPSEKPTKIKPTKIKTKKTKKASP